MDNWIWSNVNQEQLEYLINLGKSTKDIAQLYNISYDLSNLGITIPSVNYAKNDLTIDEFISLCKSVLEYNGYTVNK